MDIILQFVYYAEIYFHYLVIIQKTIKLSNVQTNTNFLCKSLKVYTPVGPRLMLASHLPNQVSTRGATLWSTNMKLCKPAEVNVMFAIFHHLFYWVSKITCTTHSTVEADGAIISSLGKPKYQTNEQPLTTLPNFLCCTWNSIRASCHLLSGIVICIMTNISHKPKKHEYIK